MNVPGDIRYRSEHFLTAPAIFPNNDIKFEVNKIRAQAFAAHRRQAITWSIAKDKPCNRVIAEKPKLVQWKRQSWCGSIAMTEIAATSTACCH